MWFTPGIIYDWESFKEKFKVTKEILCWAPDIVRETAECSAHWADRLYTYFRGGLSIFTHPIQVNNSAVFSNFPFLSTF